jgi:hypothetical protein
MAGLVPAIHVDPRDKPGDDDMEEARIQLETALVAAAANVLFPAGTPAKKSGCISDFIHFRCPWPI